MESSFETISIHKDNIQRAAQKLIDKGLVESTNETVAKEAIIKAIPEWLYAVIDEILFDIETYTYDRRWALGEFDEYLEKCANGEGLEYCPGCGMVLTVDGEYCHNCED